MRLNWHQRQRLARFLRTSIWPMPALAIAIALALGPGLRLLDEHTRWVLLGFGPDGARNVLGALASSLLTFIIFAFSTLLLAVQIASTQLTPRIIARVFEGPLAKATLSAFLFAWVYALEALGRIEDPVPQLPVAFALAASLLSTVLFVVLIQRVSQVFRPVTILRVIARETGEAIAAAHPRLLQAASVADALRGEPDAGSATEVVRHTGRPGYVVALNFAALAQHAARFDGYVRVEASIGDHVAPGDELLRLRGSSFRTEDLAMLRACVDVGPERTLATDPLFGFRILIDVAARALSPGINDPATAVQVIDQVQHLLLDLAGRELGCVTVWDESGRGRVRGCAPSWEDYLALAVTEVRVYGATSPQVTRRLRAMIEYLAQRVPAARKPAVLAEAERLERTVAGAYAEAGDRELSWVADRQGFGSRSRSGESAGDER